MIRLALLGCGWVGQKHGECAARLAPGARLVACCDVREDAAQDFARLHGCDRHYTDLGALLADGPYDGVIVATWPSQHREHILACLEAGVRHVLCEKALASSAEDALAILDAATERGATVMEAMMYRHHPALRMMERMVERGEVGPVTAVRGVFSYFSPEAAQPPADDERKRNWRLRPELAGGVPHDFASYAVNGCVTFARGLPVRVAALGTVSRHYGVVRRVSAAVDFDNGVHALIESSSDVHFDATLQVSGQRGHVRIPAAWFIPSDTRVEKLRARVWGHVEVEALEVPRADAYLLQLLQWVSVIRGEAEPQVPLVESVVATHLIDGILESHRTGRVVDVRVPERVAAAADRWRRVVGAGAG